MNDANKECRRSSTGTHEWAQYEKSRTCRQCGAHTTIMDPCFYGHEWVSASASGTYACRWCGTRKKVNPGAGW